MKYRKPSLAALVLVISCTVAWLIYADKRVAFADVLQRIRESQTVSFRITSKAKGLSTMVARQTMAAPRHVRISMRIGDKGGGISIFDHAKSAGITLIPATKKSIKMTSSDDLPKQAASSSEFIEWLKTSPDHAEEHLGPRKFDSKATFGVRVKKDGQTWDIWVDKESHLPLRMEKNGLSWQNSRRHYG